MRWDGSRSILSQWEGWGRMVLSPSLSLSCRILSKLSQEINKNEERRSIFAPRK